MRRTTGIALLASSLVALGCAPDVQEEPAAASAELLNENPMRVFRCIANPAQLALRTPAERKSFRRGCELFFEEKLGGNDRTCGTCHSNELANGDPAEQLRLHARGGAGSLRPGADARALPRDRLGRRRG